MSDYGAMVNYRQVEHKENLFHRSVGGLGWRAIMAFSLLCAGHMSAG
jgi:hypothetical protein